MTVRCPEVLISLAGGVTRATQLLQDLGLTDPATGNPWFGKVARIELAGLRLRIAFDPSGVIELRFNVGSQAWLRISARSILVMQKCLPETLADAAVGSHLGKLIDHGIANSAPMPIVAVSQSDGMVSIEFHVAIVELQPTGCR